MNKDYMNIPDHSIIKKLKSKDQNIVESGYEELYYKYSKLAYTCIKSIIRNSFDSEDITQDTFLSIFNNRDKLVSEKNLKYYVVVSAKNNALTFLSKKKLETRVDDDFIYDEAPSSNSELREIVEEIKKYLDKEEVDIILSHLLYGDTFSDIANKYNVSVNTIKTKYYRAIEKVRYDL